MAVTAYGLSVAATAPGQSHSFSQGVFLTNVFFLPFSPSLFFLFNQRDLRTLKSVAYYVADTIDSRFNLQLEGKRES